MCTAAQQINNPGSLEFTGDAVRAVATRVKNANAETKKSRRRAQSCGGLLKPRRSAGAEAAVATAATAAAAAAAAPEGTFPGRPQRGTRSTKMGPSLYKRAFPISRPSAWQGGKVEGRQLLMGSMAYSLSTINHRDPGVV
jgi:hypothetical protein